MNYLVNYKVNEPMGEEIFNTLELSINMPHALAMGDDKKVFFGFFIAAVTGETGVEVVSVNEVSDMEFLQVAALGNRLRG